MRHSVSIIVLVALAACATPDITKELTVANELLDKSGKNLRGKLSGKAKQELIALENARFAANEPVVEIVGSCDIAAARAANLAATRCDLNSLLDPGANETNATAVLQSVDVLDGYFAALTKLASTKSSDDVKKQAGALVGALEKTGSIQAESFQKLAKSAKEHGDLVVAVTGFFANQYRVYQLRRVVRKADPVIGRATEIAAAYLDDHDGTLAKAQAELKKANTAVDDAIINENQKAHRAAVVRLRKAHKDFKVKTANASAVGLLNVRQLHADLLKKLNGGGTPAELEATLKEIAEIAKLIK